jgi:dipeptidyl aminopeptidase/acylaminoacyl peptidase
MAVRAPFGAWKSPITSDLIVGQTVSLEQTGVDGADVTWIEGRPAEGGRCVLVRRGADGVARDVTPAPWNVRTRAIEYGGASYVCDRGTVWFTHYADGRLYRMDPGAAPRALTPDVAVRYADPVLARTSGRLIAVQEDHRAGGEPVHTLVAIDPGTGAVRELARGADFYAYPRLSPDEKQLAWITWAHPDMPWDATQLWVARVTDDGALADARCVAGERERVAIFQPEWGPDGALHFVSDPRGWWNFYRWQGGEVRASIEKDVEFGRPMWRFGSATYAVLADGRLLSSYCERGSWKLAFVDPAKGTMETVPLPYTEVSAPKVAGNRAYLLVGSFTEPRSLIELDLTTRAVSVIRRSAEVALDAGYLSVPEPIEFPSAGATAHAFYYAPKNADFEGMPGERPPLLVMSHGGPTAGAPSGLVLSIQYWTSRGIAVVDVNYGGSTGYGRAYRERLNGRWGIVDVDDCEAAAKHLAGSGRVDGARLAITGGSAGGYTTLAALTFRKTFKAGASHYGIGDLEALARDTHKFESRYLDRLIGPYPAAKDVYVERSPIHHVDRLACPVIFLQGLDDKIVPPNQAETMVRALSARKLPVAYVPFAGEQHGFRKAENVKRALDAEAYFYSRVFGYALADPVEPVDIQNL